MSAATAQASIEIAAPPKLVYDLVANVPEMGAWAAEVERLKWLDGATGPAVGARFRGVNQHRGRRWAKLCRVTAAEPGRRFEFHAYTAGLPHATWRYDIEPTAGGCRVTESTRRLSPRRLTVLFNRVALGVRDRDEHNQRNIERTLAQLKEHAEAAVTA